MLISTWTLPYVFFAEFRVSFLNQIRTNLDQFPENNDFSKIQMTRKYWLLEFLNCSIFFVGKLRVLVGFSGIKTYQRINICPDPNFWYHQSHVTIHHNEQWHLGIKLQIQCQWDRVLKPKNSRKFFQRKKFKKWPENLKIRKFRKKFRKWPQNLRKIKNLRNHLSSSGRRRHWVLAIQFSVKEFRLLHIATAVVILSWHLIGPLLHELWLAAYYDKLKANLLFGFSRVLF